MSTENKVPSVNITIDGVAVSVPPGTTLIQAGQKVNKFIPHFCYHPGLTVVGQCRMCFVEIEGMPKLATACSTTASEGMKVLTESPKVKAGQNSTLEFTLLHHPLDCPICDRGGECKLQDYTYDFGPPSSRMIDEKKDWDKHRDISSQIVLDQERCILCTRCVRFSSEVDGRAELVVNDRGSHNHIDVFDGHPLVSPFSGNVVDLRPVGALTARDFRFKARPWELKKHEAICTGCSMGCNVTIDTKHRHMGIARPDGQPPNPHVVRLMPRENLNINQWWMCDKGRWGYHFHNEDEKRLMAPMAKREKSSPLEKLSLKEIQLLIDAKSKNLGNEWEFWVDSSAPLELITWAKELSKSWTHQGRKVKVLNSSRIGTELLNFVSSRSATSAWLSGTVDWTGIKKVKATQSYRDLENVIPVLSLKLGTKVRKGEISWSVSKVDQMADSGDDLNQTAYLVPVPKTESELALLQKLPQNAKILILWTGLNARGLLSEGVAPIECLLEDLKNSKPSKCVFYFGQKTQNELPNEFVGYLKKADFLVTADSFKSPLTEASDVIFPLTPLMESQVTLTSLEGFKQKSLGIHIEHPNYEYLHRGGEAVSPSLKLL